MEPFIKVQQLHHVYLLEDGGRIYALRGVDLTIGRGEFVAIIGPNGSGKSTLARHLNGLLLPTQGEVWVDGLCTSDPRNLGAVRQRVGMVFQNPESQLVGSTVEEDVAFGPENRGLPPQEIRRRVDEALDIVGMQPYRLHPPHMLSGGQKQRVAIAGVLAARPDCILFDEPTSMLDPPGRQEVLETIRQLNEKAGVTVVLITQSMDEAAAAQRVVVMDKGCIVMDGPPETVFRPPGASLQALGLELPLGVEIAHRLREAGIPLPPDLLTVEQTAEALCASRPGH